MLIIGKVDSIIAVLISDLFLFKCLKFYICKKNVWTTDTAPLRFTLCTNTRVERWMPTFCTYHTICAGTHCIQTILGRGMYLHQKSFV